nr:hypothetical protein [Rickettsia asiatica]
MSENSLVSNFLNDAVIQIKVKDIISDKDCSF